MALNLCTMHLTSNISPFFSKDVSKYEIRSQHEAPTKIDNQYTAFSDFSYDRSDLLFYETLQKSLVH